jgi:hypothetical protein
MVTILTSLLTLALAEPDMLSGLTLNYAYNIRSWLTNINDVSALQGDMFALSLG